MREVFDRVGVAAGGIGVSVAGVLQVVNGVLAAILAIASIWYVGLGIAERKNRNRKRISGNEAGEKE